MGIDTPLPIALLKHRLSAFSSEHVCITQGIEDAVALRDAAGLQTAPDIPFRAMKKTLIDAVARFVARLHMNGIYHGDFTADNILVRHEDDEENMCVILIDLDAVRSNFRISARRRIKNIDELGRNFLDLRLVSTTDRAMFIKKYLSYYGRDKRSWRQLFKVVQQRTERRLAIHHRSFNR